MHKFGWKAAKIFIDYSSTYYIFTLLDELFYKYLLFHHLEIAYILVLMIYLNVQALFGLILSLHHFVINVLQMNVLKHVVLCLLLYVLVLYNIL